MGVLEGPSRFQKIGSERLLKVQEDFAEGSRRFWILLEAYENIPKGVNNCKNFLHLWKRINWPPVFKF